MEGEIRAETGTQPWVKVLDPNDRAVYEQARAEEIEDWTARTAQLIIEHLGEPVDPDKLAEAAGKIATEMRDGFEQGMQLGMEIGRKESEAKMQRMRSVELNRLGGVWG